LTEIKPTRLEVVKLNILMKN